ncbi:MAG: hypothetical protein WD513_02395, partial [Balneolaceae bacterium]
SLITMDGDQKKTRQHIHHFHFQQEKNKQKERFRWHSLFKNGQTAILLLTGIFQIKLGLLIVCIAILGIVGPLWLATLLSMSGSISFMIGGFFIYYAITLQGSFETLIGQAIQNVINSQN